MKARLSAKLRRCLQVKTRPGASLIRHRKCQMGLKFFLEMNFWRPHPSLEREIKIGRRVFSSSIKSPIRKFHVLIVK